MGRRLSSLLSVNKRYLIIIETLKKANFLRKCCFV
nr:MAG TPA: hypothetical protein [Caudoviricetes sp.]